MSITAFDAFTTAKLTLRAIVQYLSKTKSVEVFDEEPPSDSLASWATRLRLNGETTVSWHIVADEDGLVDVSRSVSFMTSHDEPINHTVIVKQFDLAEMGTFGTFGLSSALLSLIIGTTSVPITSRKEAREWVRVAHEDASYIWATGMTRVLSRGLVMTPLLLNDDAEFFSMIHETAETQVGHGLGRHKETWSSAGVPFHSADIYQDAFTEKAAELVSSIRPGGL